MKNSDLSKIELLALDDAAEEVTTFSVADSSVIDSELLYRSINFNNSLLSGIVLFLGVICGCVLCGGLWNRFQK